MSSYFHLNDLKTVEGNWDTNFHKQIDRPTTDRSSDDSSKMLASNFISRENKNCSFHQLQLKKILTIKLLHDQTVHVMIFVNYNWLSYYDINLFWNKSSLLTYTGLSNNAWPPVCLNVINTHISLQLAKSLSTCTLYNQNKLLQWGYYSKKNKCIVKCYLQWDRRNFSAF